MGCGGGAGWSTPTAFVGATGSALLVETGFTRMGFVVGSCLIDVDVEVEVEGEAEIKTEVEIVCVGGSAGVSRPAAPGSSCSPIVFKGRRRVPLLGAGSIPTESQSML